MIADFNIQMQAKEFKALSKYLCDHEFDIANEIDNYGDLRGLFVAVFEEEPDKLAN